MTILVTGAAGFVGFHVSQALLARGQQVIGLDNLNSYYDTALKHARLALLEPEQGFTFQAGDVADFDGLVELLARHQVTGVVHLAAQAGVRYSLENPLAYAESNVTGQVAMFEACRRHDGLTNLVYASSSSVYGGNEKVPFSIEDPVDQPASLYAATKRAGELIGRVYAKLYDLPTTGLRFFTVYGPWGRPDMAYYSFTKAILEGQPIRVFNHGKMRRDFTAIEDIVPGVLAALDHPPDSADGVPQRLYNLGNHRAESLMHFIEVLEQACGRSAEKVMEGMQAGDVVETFADIEASRRDLGYDPKTTIDEGLPRFVEWYRGYHKV